MDKKIDRTWFLGKFLFIPDVAYLFDLKAWQFWFLGPILRLLRSLLEIFHANIVA